MGEDYRGCLAGSGMGRAEGEGGGGCLWGDGALVARFRQLPLGF
jgi:hypothetical protein